MVALQGLRDKGRIQPGQKVLINAAAGGIGTFAVQIAKVFGAEVTGVCSSAKVELVRSIGADHVIDYTREDFTRSGEHYDLVVATGGYRSIFDYRRALTPTGTYVMTGGATAQVFEAALLGPMLSAISRQRLGSLIVRQSRGDLLLIKDLIDSGRVVPVIDRQFPLQAVADAVRYYGQGHSSGKVVISMEEDGG